MSLPVEIEIIETGSEFVVRFAVGVQSFTLQTYSDTLQLAEYIEALLRNALMKAGATVCVGKRSSIAPVDEDVQRLATHLDALGDERTSGKGASVSDSGVSHTPEPLWVEGWPRTEPQAGHFAAIFGKASDHGEDFVVADMRGQPNGDYARSEGLATAWRLVNCYNDCADIPDPGAEFTKLRGQVTKLTQAMTALCAYSFVAENQAAIGARKELATLFRQCKFLLAEIEAAR